MGINLKKNIVLLGMMGVGKSTIGKLLSKKLKMKFVDTDTEIEKKMKMTIPQIFKQRSEAFFRAKEKDVASQFLNNHNQVIALGGGTFLNREIRDNVKKNSISFYLYLNNFEIFKRIKLSKKQRPLLPRGKEMKNIASIVKKRETFYKKAMFKLNCNYLNKSQVVNKLIKIYKNETFNN